MPHICQSALVFYLFKLNLKLTKGTVQEFQYTFPFVPLYLHLFTHILGAQVNLCNAKVFECCI